MRDTGSTRTATRWSWCSALAGAALLAACVTRTTTYFEPPAGSPHLTGGEMRDRGEALLAGECPRLTGSRATGVARIGLTVNRQGEVTRAQLDRSSGDKRVDEIFGTLTAMLQFDPPTGMKGETITVPTDVGYHCSADAHVMSFKVIQPGAVQQPAGTQPPG